MKTVPMIIAVAGLALAAFAAAPAAGPNAFESPAAPVAAGRIDEFVFEKLTVLGLSPALCSDAVFVRRAYLDVIGTLPTAKEARAFIQDPDTANKRGG